MIAGQEAAEDTQIFEEGGAAGRGPCQVSPQIGQEISEAPDLEDQVLDKPTNN